MAYYKYGGWWSVWWTGSYSMVLTKAAFFHRTYLDLYTHEMPSSIHDYITKVRYQLISYLWVYEIECMVGISS